MFIPSAEIPGPEGSISPFSFYGQLPDFTRFLTWLTSGWVLLQWNENVGSVQILSYCICVWCESGELGSRRSLRFLYVTPVVETFSSDSISFRTPSNINNTAPLWKRLMALTCRTLPSDFKCGSDRRCCECRVWVDCKCMEFLAADWCTKMLLRLDQTIRNLNSGDSGIPLVVIRLRVTRWKRAWSGHVSARLFVWGKRGERAVWCGTLSDHWANGSYIDVLFTCGECGFGS